jgi:hypothetical protein
VIERAKEVEAATLKHTRIQAAAGHLRVQSRISEKEWLLRRSEWKEDSGEARREA